MKTIGIIGSGHIGQAVALRLFKIKVPVFKICLFKALILSLKSLFTIRKEELVMNLKLFSEVVKDSIHNPLLEQFAANFALIIKTKRKKQL